MLERHVVEEFKCIGQDRIESIAIHPTVKSSGYSRNFVIKFFRYFLSLYCWIIFSGAETIFSSGTSSHSSITVSCSSSAIRASTFRVTSK